jgi:hypothetical protein
VCALSRAFRAEATRSADDIGDELLRFWAKHWFGVVILLDRAERTDYAAFGARLVERLVASTLADLRTLRRASAAARFVLARIFDNTRRMLAAILDAHADERVLREAIEAFWSYQIPGLQGFARWSDRPPDAGRRGAGGASVRRQREARSNRPRSRAGGPCRLPRTDRPSGGPGWRRGVYEADTTLKVNMAGVQVQRPPDAETVSHKRW